MAENIKHPEHMVFGLDIGTRSIVGSVGYMDKNKFNVIAHYVKEHDTRAMMDGQIHDITKVGETISFVKEQLEKQIDRPLNDVCIAAAGRVLKTITVNVNTERVEDSKISDEEIYSLDLLGVEKAYDIIRSENSDINFYCVGYTVVKYYMNDYIINNLEGHKAKKIGADVLATFLPQEVVDGLYSAVNTAGLQVANLTLEPIAAMNVAIPEQYRLLNIALVDVGAGTSDICITKDGSIVAYGMIPHAGDEITESIVHHCLVDFQTAEKIKRASLGNKQISYKDIMGITHKIAPGEIRTIYSDIVSRMTGEIAEKIKELNGGKSVNAVFIVGGGGKAHSFTDSLASSLDIPKERVALRGAEVLGDVNFLVDGVKKDPLLVTPIGICINYYAQKNNFIILSVNGQRVKLYDNDKVTVVSAVMQSGLPNMDLFPKRGAELNFTVNGIAKMIRGQLGDGAVITVNDKEANLNTRVGKNDKIFISPSSQGADARYTVEQLPEYKTILTFNVNGKNIDCPKMAIVNGELVTGLYEIKNNDQIIIPDHYKLSELMSFMDIDTTDRTITINGHISVEDELIYNEFKINISEPPVSEETVYEANTSEVNTSETPVSKTHISEESIVVIVNRTPVTLKGKDKYIFVDVLDNYPFDTSTAGGLELIMTINGEKATFATGIKDGDILELYWKK